MTNLNILVIHGMGSQRKFYSHPMRDDIRGRVGDQWADRVRWEEVYWADVTRQVLDRQRSDQTGGDVHQEHSGSLKGWK
jgi:hypothetical protein